MDRHHQLCLDEKDDKVPMRKLWVLSPGRPDGGFDALGVRPATELGSGMYFSSAFLEIWVVVHSELPKTPDTRLLRLLSRDLRAEVLAEIAALPGNAPDGANNAKLLRLLAIVPAAARTARFRCVLALTEVGSAPRPRTLTFEGACEGRIGFVQRGDHGFGYDPLFVPEGHEVTFAELGEEAKNRISHRSRALEKLIAWMDGPVPA